MRKGEIACNNQFLLFSQCFLPYMALIFHFKCTLKCRLQFVLIWTSLKFCCLVMGYEIMRLLSSLWIICSPVEKHCNPFPHNDTFSHPWETSLLKTLWEKEKLLVTSNFSFSYSVFYSI